MAVYVADLRSTSGWTERWSTTEGSVAVVSDAFRITKTAEAGRYAFTWDTIDSDANRDNAEILAKVRIGAQAEATQMIGVVARGSGAAGSEDCVFCILLDGTNDGNDFRPYVAEYVTGNITLLGASGGKSNTVSTWYWLKMRVNGNSIKARAWADGVAEPSTWAVDTTTAVAAAGWVGIYARDTATDPYDVGYFAVATNGDTIGGSSGGFFLGADF